MSGTLALHILYCNILCMLCILLWNQFFYSYIVSLVVLRNFCKYFVGMTDKVRRTTAFLSWYSQTSLLEVRFALTLHAWTKLFFFFFFFSMFLLFLFSTKRGGGYLMQSFFQRFQLSHVYLYVLTVLCALIEYAFIWLRF
jgi:hypothetical protein